MDLNNFFLCCCLSTFPSLCVQHVTFWQKFYWQIVDLIPHYQNLAEMKRSVVSETIKVRKCRLEMNALILLNRIGFYSIVTLMFFCSINSFTFIQLFSVLHQLNFLLRLNVSSSIIGGFQINAFVCVCFVGVRLMFCFAFLFFSENLGSSPWTQRARKCRRSRVQEPTHSDASSASARPQYIALGLFICKINSTLRKQNM